MGKVILMAGLIAFTFFVMVGVNPLHDRFGFRYWNRKFHFPNFLDLPVNRVQRKMFLVPLLLSTSPPDLWDIFMGLQLV
jgi:amino acid permease